MKIDVASLNNDAKSKGKAYYQRKTEGIPKSKPLFSDIVSAPTEAAILHEFNNCYDMLMEKTTCKKHTKPGKKRTEDELKAFTAFCRLVKADRTENGEDFDERYETLKEAHNAPKDVPLDEQDEDIAFMLESMGDDF